MRTNYLITNVFGHEDGWKLCSISRVMFKNLVNIGANISFSYYHFFARYR